MDINAARIILSNLRDRVEAGNDGRFRLAGIITKQEIEAFDFLISGALAEGIGVVASSSASAANENGNSQLRGAPELVDEPVAPVSYEHEIELDLSSLSLPDSNSGQRVCLDFGTAMSKATLVSDNEDADFEEIRVLRLGIPGNQEEVDEIMLVSSLFIDASSRLWFGQNAVEQAHAAPNDGNTRLDNIKRWLSEGNLGTPVEPIHNPTLHDINYEHLVLAYLAFLTWAINRALASDVADMNVPRNFRRRFAMPCFPRANAKLVEQKLMGLLGEAQVLADTFNREIHEGLDLGRFLSAVKQLRANKREYSFIEGSVTEPLGVAGSLLSWRNSHDSLALVVDIGAGTSDFSLYRLRVSLDDDGEIESSKTLAMEVDKSARGITEAGNHLDHILKAFILSRAGITSEHPKFINIAYDLERNIRDYKETLFNSGSVFIVLYNDDTVEISLNEFLDHDAVKAFEGSLRRTMTEILESVSPDFINWVKSNASRYLTIVLTGGGASLPMARKLASGTVVVNGSPVAVAAAQEFPAWLRQDYADLEDHYARIAVSLGGARRNVIRSIGVATGTGSGLGGYTLERFPTKGV